MSDAVGWEQLKDLGNAAFKEKQFTTAAEHFSDAIDLDPANHVLYSNRSGAYASMGGKWQEALDDADKCIALKADWAKGYSRKGAAHLGMGQVPKAKEAFEAGLKLDPENAAFKAALAQLASSARSSPAMPSARGFPYTKPPPAPLLTGPSLLINYAIVGSTMAYMLPLFGLRVAFYAYRMAALACFVKFAMQLFGQFGVSPRTLFAERSKVFAHDAAHYTLLSITLMLMRPVPFVLVPMAANAVLLMLPALVEHAKVLPERVRGLVLPRLETAHAEQRQMYIHAFASTSEVMVIFGILLSCCANPRSIGFLLFYFNFLTWRWGASDLTKQAVAVLRMKLDEWAHHPWAPKLLGILYEKGKVYLITYTAVKVATPPTKAD